MRAVVQRVREASVAVEGDVTASIGPGILVLLGVASTDTTAEAEWLAGKVARLRIFDDGAGRFDRSLLDLPGAALVVSQFTLIADTRKGNRPSFADAADHELAERLYERFAGALAQLGVAVSKGVFGAHMDVALTNDGPVTVLLDSERPQM